MTVLQLAQALAGPPGRLTISLAVPQPTDQGAHLLLTVTDRTLQTLPALLLALR